MTDSNPPRQRPTLKRAILIALLATVALWVVPVLQAQDSFATKFTARTGSYGLFPRFTAHATLTETDPAAPDSWVSLAFLDQTGRVLKRTRARLSYDEPVTLPISYWKAGGRLGKRVVVRVVAEVTTPIDGSLNSVILTMERHNPTTGSLTTGPECPVGAEDPAGPGGPILPSCGCDVDQQPADDVFPQ